MNLNIAYFERNQGEWNWQAHFNIISWKELWHSSISLPHKLRIAILVLSQSIFGNYKMWTHVEFDKSARTVHHSLDLFKWGMSVYRSHKIFLLDTDGRHLKLSGEENYWPFLAGKSKFSGLTGHVEDSTTGSDAFERGQFQRFTGPMGAKITGLVEDHMRFRQSFPCSRCETRQTQSEIVLSIPR